MFNRRFNNKEGDIGSTGFWIVALANFLYGFSRMYQSLVEVRNAPSTVEVFRNEKDARKWLGLESDGD